jgi:uncharacterized membrane protein
MINLKDSSGYMSKSRLETLVDGIFAIAMTLLVFDLPIPRFNGPLTDTIFQSSIYSLLPVFISLILSFILLAVFWNIHRRIFNQIDVTNNILLWINIIWLLFIVLVPFTSILSGEYGQFILSRVLFNANMLGIAVFLYLNCYFVSRSEFLNEKSDMTKLKSSERSSLFFIVITILALFLAFLTPHWSFVYVLIIPFELLIDRLF